MPLILRILNMVVIDCWARRSRSLRRGFLVVLPPPALASVVSNVSGHHIWALKLKELSCESCDRRKRFSTLCNSIRYYVRGPVMVQQCRRRCLWGSSCGCGMFLLTRQHDVMWTLPISLETLQETLIRSAKHGLIARWKTVEVCSEVKDLLKCIT